MFFPPRTTAWGIKELYVCLLAGEGAEEVSLETGPEQTTKLSCWATPSRRVLGLQFSGLLWLQHLAGKETRNSALSLPSLKRIQRPHLSLFPQTYVHFYEKQLKFLPSWTHPLLSRLIRDRETISGSSHRFSLCVHSRQESFLGFLCTINDITIINNCNCGNDYSKQHSLSCYVLTIPLCPL